VKLVCSDCNQTYSADPRIWRCTHCGAWLDFRAVPFRRETVEARDQTLWRYRAMIPLPPNAPIVTLGEGGTPLVDAELDGHRVYFKLEFLAPTGSFKDRGTTVLVSALKAAGVTHAADDSSGNAGASFAAYAARAGIAATLFVPSYASPAKLAQIAVYGATLVKVDGPRENATLAAEEATRDAGLVYATHAWSPFTLQGTKTIAYEIAEQLAWRAPDVFIAPIGQGTLLLGAQRGFAELLDAGLISKLPRLIGVQSVGCAPIAEGFQRGLTRAVPIDKKHTIAEGISIAKPVRAAQILRALRATGGTVVTVTDDAILEARASLARRGLFVEPTSATVVAALKQIEVSGIVVAALTGSGLKSATS